MYLALRNPQLEKSFGPLFDDMFPVEERTSNFEAWEDDEKVVVSILLPGFKKDEIEIEGKDGILSVSACKKEEEPNSKRYLRKMPRQASFSKKFAVHNDVDLKNGEAKVESGILVITLPKKEEAKAVKIKIA